MKTILKIQGSLDLKKYPYDFKTDFLRSPSKANQALLMNPMA